MWFDVSLKDRLLWNIVFMYIFLNFFDVDKCKMFEFCFILFNLKPFLCISRSYVTRSIYESIWLRELDTTNDCSKLKQEQLNNFIVNDFLLLNRLKIYFKGFRINIFTCITCTFVFFYLSLLLFRIHKCNWQRLRPQIL